MSPDPDANGPPARQSTDPTDHTQPTSERGPTATRRMIETESTPIATPPARRDLPPIRGVDDRPGIGSVDAAEYAQETVIQPRSGWVDINWHEMWAQRELLAFLVWRDITVRYKQTVLGPAWAVVQPLMMTFIFTLIFGRFVQIPTDPFPYPVFAFAGLIPWTLFSQGFSASAMSLINNQYLMTKVYFPRLFFPIASACVFAVDLLISLGLYVVILAYYGIVPSWQVIYLPALILLTLVATLGPGLLIASLTVFYRDFKHLVPFLVQICMYVVPVIYPAKMISQRWQYVLSVNPMFGIIKAYRSAILGDTWDLGSLAISTASAVALFVFSLKYFRKTEREFADFA
jgi:lipopolysaccharide transport system permease protein